MASKVKQSEAQLCEAFKGWATAQGFVCYPEVSDYDLVLTPGPELIGTPGYHQPPGYGRLLPMEPADKLPQPWEVHHQIGVQAKLSGNVDVLYQATSSECPSYRAVLVPRASFEFKYVASQLGVAVVTQEIGYGAWGRQKWKPAEKGFAVVQSRMKLWPAAKPLWLPPVVADIPAGGPSPQQLTKWRISALKLCRLLRERGWLTAEDFKGLKVDRRRWIDSGWLVASGRLKQLRYVICNADGLPDVGWTHPPGTQKELDEYIDAWYTETCSVAPPHLNGVTDERK